MMLAAIGVLLFLSSVHRGDHDQAERMSLLPLEDDDGTHREESVPERGGAREERDEERDEGRDKEGIDL